MAAVPSGRPGGCGHSDVPGMESPGAPGQMRLDLRADMSALIQRVHVHTNLPNLTAVKSARLRPLCRFRRPGK